MLRLRLNQINPAALLFAVLFASAFVRCASIAQPQGGPRDSLPPLIVSTSPAQKSVDFQGKKITLDFNEYIQLLDQQKEFLVSPVGDKKPALVIKGRSLEVSFDNDLEPNTTYRLDFGNSIADNNESNRMGDYAFIFSTGPTLDTLMMSGMVVDAQTRDTVINAFVFFFNAEDDFTPEYDSTLFNARARAVFRTDSSGQFLADILQDRFYRIYAIKDENGNQRYEAGTDYVAFMDTVYNPTYMPDFDIWIDPAEDRRGPRRRIDPPQIRMELFKEEPVRRQIILEATRPERQKLQIVFNSRHAQIESFRLSGIDSTWLLRETGVYGDTVWYWVAPPSKEEVEALRDTIRGEITYISQDSLWQPLPRTENVAFTHRISVPGQKSRSAIADSIIQAKKEAKRLKKATRLQKKWLKKARKISRKRGDPPRPDSVLLRDSTLFQQVKVDTTLRAETDPADLLAPNPFRYTVKANNPLNPQTSIQLSFANPLRSIDSSRIELYHLSTAPVDARTSRGRTAEEMLEQPPAQEIPVPFWLEVDSLALGRNVTIRADWQKDQEYRLLIPDSVFTDIAFHTNDTLPSTFKVADPDKFGTLILELSEEGSVEGSEYILELMTREMRPMTRFTHARPGDSFTIRYLAPGSYRLRITEDRNGNGEWDTGSLVERRQPERIRIYKGPDGNPDLITKENWEVVETIDLPGLFSQP